MIERFFSRYPKEFRWLFPIFILQQHTYYTIFEMVKNRQGEDWSDTNYSIVNGTFILMAGFFADRYDDLKKRLANVTVFILIGGWITTFDDNFFLILGFLIFQFFSCVFFITILVRIAKFFTSVDIRKFDAFLSLTFFNYLSVIFLNIIILSSTYFEIEFLEIIFLVLSFIGIFYLIKQLEYSPMPIRKQGQSNLNFVWILLGIIGISFLSSLASYIIYEIFPLKEQELSSIYLVAWLVLTFLFNGYIFYWLFRKKINYEIDFLRVLIIGLSIQVALYLFIYIMENPMLYTIVNYEQDKIDNFILSPIFIVLLTHNYFGKNMGKIIGLEVSVTHFVSFIVVVFISPSFYVESLLIILTVILMIISMIYKNKEFLNQILKINQSHEVEIIEEEPEDPFDHLIDNNL